jgi:hypothetical protein
MIEGYGKVCAFLNTTSDNFILSDDGQHLFKDSATVLDHSDRLFRLLPEGFFNETTTSD